MIASTSSISDTGTQSIARLDAWLETMRCADGYGGPVAHWWQNSLHFTGGGLDWRCEGLITGYLACGLVEKAQRAGDDLLNGQLADGRFSNSQFELNPYPGGTPHEAACDIGLLMLAAHLRQENNPAWETYLYAAEHNLRDFYIARLWNSDLLTFCDDESRRSFVPNKAATVVEALFLWATLTDSDEAIERYAQPTLEAVLRLQVHSGAARGAFPQYSTNRKTEPWYFPYYVARCIPALATAHRWTQDQRYRDAAEEALAFLKRWQFDDGSFPQVIYTDGRVNRYPQWIAGAADIVWAARRLGEDLPATVDWLLMGQMPTGGFRTAHGFASQTHQRTPKGLPEFRDLLPVCGWNDKVLRLLSESASGELPATKSITPYETDCMVGGRVMQYREDKSLIELRYKTQVVYRWQKGDSWAEVCDSRWLWK